MFISFVKPVRIRSNKTRRKASTGPDPGFKTTKTLSQNESLPSIAQLGKDSDN